MCIRDSSWGIAIAALALIPVIWFVLVDRPSDVGLLPYGADPNNPPAEEHNTEGSAATAYKPYKVKGQRRAGARQLLRRAAAQAPRTSSKKLFCTVCYCNQIMEPPPGDPGSPEPPPAPGQRRSPAPPHAHTLDSGQGRRRRGHEREGHVPQAWNRT